MLYFLYGFSLKLVEYRVPANAAGHALVAVLMGIGAKAPPWTKKTPKDFAPEPFRTPGPHAVIRSARLAAMNHLCAEVANKW